MTEEVQQLFGAKRNESEDLMDTLNFDDLDITNVTETINFDEIDGLMEKFKEDPRIQEILEQGLDVREYSQNVEKLLEKAEKDSVEDYVKQQGNLANLHQEIASCDSILESMESILHRFQFDLGNISDEIRSLQEQSSTMNIKLENRKGAAQDLHTFIQEISLPKRLVKNICDVNLRAGDTSVEETYLDFLTQLNKKIKFSTEQGKQVLATKDIDPELEKLRIKAVAKVREYMLQVINIQLRKPNTNVQVQQQVELRNLKKFNEFLSSYGPQHAKEIRMAYIETMQKIYFIHFRDYIAGLAKLSTEIGGKYDLLGVEENQGKGFFSSRFAKNRSNVFSMGVPSRDAVLHQLEGDCLVLHEVQAKKQTFPFEIIFRNIMFYFKSAVVSESSFDNEFFNQTVDLFNHIFGKATLLFTECVSNYTSSSFDAIGILIMIRIAKHYSNGASEKKIVKLAKFFDSIIEILRPRFFGLFSLHLESIRNADPRILGLPDPSKVGGLGPHYVIRRYAEFASAIHCLNPENNQAIATKLAALRNQMQKLMLRLATPLQNIPKVSPVRCKQKQTVFLINNMDHILSVLSNRNIDVEDAHKWKAAMEQQTTSLCDVLLAIYFDKLIKFQKAATKSVEQGLFNWNSVQATAKEIAIHFGENNLANITKLAKNIRETITNLLTGMEILQTVLNALVTSYTAFESLVRDNTEDPSILNGLVTSVKLKKDVKNCNLFQ